MSGGVRLPSGPHGGCAVIMGFVHMLSSPPEGLAVLWDHSVTPVYAGLGLG
jgi:hypothetical protein